MEHKLLKPYRNVLDRLTLFIRKYDKQPNQANRQRILHYLDVVKSFDTSIRLNADDVDMAMAYKLKRKIITYFDQCISGFVHQKGFTKEIESVKDKLKKTITFEEVALLQPITVSDKPQSKAPLKQRDIHSKHNPNLWDKNTYELFKYLYDNYYSEGRLTKRKLTNIWFYLKEYDNSKYVLKAIKEEYIKFIKDKYNEEITNFDKATTKYNEKDYPTMNEHRINFESFA